MKVTSIRDNKGEIPSTDTLLNVERELRKRMKKLGFISDVSLISPTSMKIGLHMCSFRIDAKVLGHNADYSYSGQRCKAGFKRTSVPTWKQREDFNHMVNDMFDKFKLSARIMSGAFEVRTKEGRIDVWSSSVYGASERLFEIQEMV